MGDVGSSSTRRYDRRCLSAQRDSIIDFARLCLPQVFFYGMYVLVGQVLNARGRFGPMMWAPIANNAISIVVLVDLPRRLRPRRRRRAVGAFTPGQELLLGLGATARHRRPVPDPGALPAGDRLPLPAALRLPSAPGSATPSGSGVWTVLFVIVNQIAYTVVVRLASGGTSAVACDGGDARTGDRLHDLLDRRS